MPSTSSWQEKYKLLILNSKQIGALPFRLLQKYLICCDLWQLLRIHTENIWWLFGGGFFAIIVPLCLV